MILLAAEEKDIPFDLKHLRHIVYGGDITVLSQQLADTLKRLDVRQYSLSLAEGKSGAVSPPLSGGDQFLYKAEIDVHYVGDDGVKFWLRVYRLVAGNDDRKEIYSSGCFLGKEHPTMKVPEIPWSLCYKQPTKGIAHLILGRPRGWEEAE